MAVGHITIRLRNFGVLPCDNGTLQFCLEHGYLGFECGHVVAQLALAILNEPVSKQGNSDE